MDNDDHTLTIYRQMVERLQRLGYTQEEIDGMVINPMQTAAPYENGKSGDIIDVEAHEQLPEDSTVVDGQTTPPGPESTPHQAETERAENQGTQEQVSQDAQGADTQGDSATVLPSQQASQSEGQNIVGTLATSTARAREHSLRRETALELCRRVAEGESMRQVVKDADMPAISTFLRWASEDPEIARMYTQALQMRAAGFAEDLVTDAERALKCTEAHEVQAIKLQVNTKQWIISKLLPKVYGEHTQIEHVHQVQLDEKQINTRLELLIRRLQSGG